MVGSKFLLDTNIVVAWFKGEENVVDKIIESSQIFIPSIVIGELMFGAMNSMRVETNVAPIIKLIREYPVISIDSATAKEYGILKSKLKKDGKPIPENDIWIAALAKQYNMPLVTRDGHFGVITNIEVVSW